MLPAIDVSTQVVNFVLDMFLVSVLERLLRSVLSLTCRDQPLCDRNVVAYINSVPMPRTVFCSVVAFIL